MKFRNEYKHSVSYFDTIELKQKLKKIMTLDLYCNKDGYYTVKSLYFDNYKDKALREKITGINKREKFRIRYYGNDTSFIRVEKKSKIDGKCSKEQCQITADECKKIINGDIEFLKHSENNLLRELYAKMKFNLLRPKNIVVYDRESFTCDPGNTRITLDSNIRTSYSAGMFLNPDIPLLKSGTETVLEVKWTGYLPEYIRKVVGLKGRHTSSFSKYAYTRKF